MKLLWKAIAEWLRSDNTLVTLTGHSDSDIRISRSYPEVEAKKPALLFSIGVESAQGDTGSVRQAPIIFTSLGETPIQVTDIDARLRELLNPTDDVGRRRGADFTNDDIRNMSVDFVSSNPVYYNDVLDCWVKITQANVFWHERG